MRNSSFRAAHRAVAAHVLLDQLQQRAYAAVDRRPSAALAGREIRIMVTPETLDDDAAALLSHEIARQIEKQLDYPGQIKVTVIRESRAVDYAR